MAQTVASHAVAALTSPVNGDPLSATVVLSNDNTVRAAYVNHDADPGIHLQSSTLASRPAFGSEGRKWLSADTGSYRLFFDTGSAWQELSYLRTDAAGSITSTLTIVNPSADTLCLQSSTTATGANYLRLISTGGTYEQGIENSANTLYGVGAYNYFLAVPASRSLAVFVGGTGVIGTFSSTGLALTALTLSGNLVANGNVTLGNASSDTITPTGRFASDLDPNANGTLDIGASGLAFRNGWFTDTITTATVSATSRMLTAVGSAGSPSIAETSDLNTGLFFPAADTVGVSAGGTERLRVDVPSAGQTALFVYDADNATLERVTVGAADSGGLGFKVLRIPN